jgi:hypothetical protein
MKDPIVQQLLLTRFNVDPALMGAPATRPREWLEARFELFARYCAPSVAAQTEEGFEWIVFCDEHTAPEDLTRLRAFDPRIRITLFARPTGGERDADQPPSASPVPAREGEGGEVVLTTLCVHPHVRPGVDVVVSTRLDNDDALSRHALRRVRDHLDRFLATGHARWVYNPRLGYRLDHRTGRLYQASSRSSPFLTMFERVPDGGLPLGPYSGNHAEAYRHHPTYQDTGARLWLQVVHGGNVRNRIKAEAPEVPVAALGGDFAVALPAAI